MCEIRTITVEIPVADNSHGMEVSSAMRRVSELSKKIWERNPQGWYGVGRAIADAETAVEGCNFAEVEFAAYLAGLAARLGEGGAHE